MFDRIVNVICRSSFRHPYLWLLVTALITVPAVYESSKVGLNTDLTRLLPKNSKAVYWSRELQPKVGGDGGYFSVLFEGKDQPKLEAAVAEMAERLKDDKDVGSAEFSYPLEFFQKYRYLLIPSNLLQKIFDTVVRWKAEASPLGLKLDPNASGSAGAGVEKNVEDQFRRYGHLSEHHQSEDGTIHGLIVRPTKGISSLGSTERLFDRLEAMAGEVGGKYGLWSGVSGSLRNKVDEFKQIRSDLNVSGSIALAGIIIVLALMFRSIRVLPVLLYPIILGLMWSFALVPATVGDLNTITSFLIMVLLGMGVEWSIHLVTRYTAELETMGPEEALIETFRSTGRSVVTSGFTTATGLVVLAFSNFRGFSEYGLISAGSMLMIFTAMFTVQPAALVIGQRFKLVQAQQPLVGQRNLVPPPWATYILGGLVVVSAILAIRGLAFDYDFASLKAEVQSAQEVRDRHRKVYPGFSAPAALYVVKSMGALDDTIQRLETTRKQGGHETVIGSIASIRDYAPDANEAQARRQVLVDLQDRLQGRWIRHVQDAEKKTWIEDIREFKAPDQFPTVADLPPEITKNVMARDGSGDLLLAVDTPSGTNKDGRFAMKFANELRAIQLPADVQGPTGDKLVLAEILELVTGEAPLLIGFTFLGIVVLVLLDRRGSASETFWILLPLTSGIVMTLGGMVALGWKLNFFNMVVLPSLIGMTVDNGVHSYRRWEELGFDTQATQRELFDPLTGSALTTVMGYAGMVFAHHQGLRSIGSLAVLGLTCCWLSGVALMPGILRIRERGMKQRRGVQTPSTPVEPDPHKVQV